MSTNNETEKNNANSRELAAAKKASPLSFFKSWEMILVYILVIINVVLMIARSDLYFKAGTIQAIIESGMDVAPLVLGMILVLMLGDIDVSCAANMIFASMCTGLLMQNGAPMLLSVIVGLLGSTACGAFNGFLVAYIGMPSVIVTISTSMLFRGIVEIVLDVNSLKVFPDWYKVLAWNSIGPVPISLIVFLLMGLVFIFLLQKSKFGRSLYIMGNNRVCARYSGIPVKKYQMMVFVIMGLMSGVASIFFVGRMGNSVSSSMGTGYEMTAIATCVLGGVSTNGGRGKVYGPIIATLIMAFLTYTLGLMNIDANIRKIVIGIVLIIAILISNVREMTAKNAGKPAVAAEK